MAGCKLQAMQWQDWSGNFLFDHTFLGWLGALYLLERVEYLWVKILEAMCAIFSSILADFRMLCKNPLYLQTGEFWNCDCFKIMGILQSYRYYHHIGIRIYYIYYALLNSTPISPFLRGSKVKEGSWNPHNPETKGINVLYHSK